MRDLLLEGPPNVRFVRARFPVDAIVLVMEEEEEEEEEDELVYPYPFLCPFQWVIALHIVCWSVRKSKNEILHWERDEIKCK